MEQERTDHAFEGRVQVRDAKVEELRELRHEGVVHDFKDFLRCVKLLLRLVHRNGVRTGGAQTSRHGTHVSDLDGIVGPLLVKLPDLRSGGIVVEQLQSEASSELWSHSHPTPDRRPPRTFLFRFEMAALTSGQYEQSFPTGSSTVARYGAS